MQLVHNLRAFKIFSLKFKFKDLSKGNRKKTPRKGEISFILYALLNVHRRNFGWGENIPVPLYFCLEKPNSYVAI